MLYKINNNYNSSKLLFSIPVHEKQDIINNQIENILNFNPKSKIILHVNKSFIPTHVAGLDSGKANSIKESKTFDAKLTKYKGVYVNSKSFNYEFAKGLLFIHINNFLEAIHLKLDFEYFIIISSNEMFIKKGLISYIEQFKNGAQIVKFDTNIDWHNFHKNIQNDSNILSLLNDLNLDSFYGGQTEGQFYQKHNFQKIAEIYLKHFGARELSNFETEEIACQTIFKSFNIEYGLPFTLQNYSNNITFDEIFINKVINNTTIIPYNAIKGNLASAHINLDCSSIFSIKRVDRNFNNIRNFLSRKGFIFRLDNKLDLDKGDFDIGINIMNNLQLNTYYYSNNSSLIFYNNNHLKFTKLSKQINVNYNWFGYEIEEGYYDILFEIKLLKPLLKNIENIGLKIHYPYEMIYNFFFENLNILEWKSISIPLHITKKQYVIFIFDNYNDFIDIEFKNIRFDTGDAKDAKDTSQMSQKESIVISLYENESNYINNDYSINYTNIYNMIIEPFEKIYNIYIFISLYKDSKINKIINYYKPNNILYLDKNETMNDIFIKSTDQIINFSNLLDINFKFVIYFSLDSIFKKNIIDFNFYINKFNFISYHIPYINNQISNSYEFLSVPYKYINNFYKLINDNRENKNICYLIYSNLKNDIDKNNFNFVYDDNYYNNMRTPLIKYLSDINDTNNNEGYIFNKKYLNNIYYRNKYSKILKDCNNEFYFHKINTSKHVPYQWLGLYIDNQVKLDPIKTDDILSDKTNITIEFEIKLIKNIVIAENISDYGIKIHEPLMYYTDWINNCKLNIYTKIILKTSIKKKNQYIILNFDNYLNEVEFYIRDFKIILE